MDHIHFLHLTFQVTGLIISSKSWENRSAICTYNQLVTEAIQQTRTEILIQSCDTHFRQLQTYNSSETQYNDIICEIYDLGQ